MVSFGNDWLLRSRHALVDEQKVLIECRGSGHTKLLVAYSRCLYDCKTSSIGVRRFALSFLCNSFVFWYLVWVSQYEHTAWANQRTP